MAVKIDARMIALIALLGIAAFVAWRFLTRKERDGNGNGEVRPGQPQPRPFTGDIPFRALPGGSPLVGFAGQRLPSMPVSKTLPGRIITR